MKHIVSLRTAVSLLALAALSAVTLHAQPAETIRVQTFTYGSPHDAEFVFPPATERFEKILMHYKLRCPFDGPCGEWDYLAYIYLFDKTGKIDSTRDTAVSYRVNGLAPDSINFMLTPSWRYIPRFVENAVRTSTTSFDSALVGTGTSALQFASTSGDPNRMQFLWKEEELKSGGLNQGAITGLRFNFMNSQAGTREITIRMKASALDSLTPNSLEDGGWTTVYSGSSLPASAGWKALQFPRSFVWDGSSNIVVDISMEGGNDGQFATVAGGATDFSSSVMALGDDFSRRFEGRDYIEVPAAALAPVDSFITVAFWQYGDPARQPQEQSTFEAFDKFGRRVLNVHAPWGDTLVYWDAGTNSQGSYDRLTKKATSPSDYEGKWNHWTFTKNARTGQMKIYLNGALWASGGSKRRAIGGITSFKIGSMGDGNRNYDGDIDEFAVWNAELDANTIRDWFRRTYSSTHPFHDRLLLFYDFEDPSLASALDISGKGMHGMLVGPPQHVNTTGATLKRGFQSMAGRPNVVFEQGVYTTRIDSTLRIDSVENAPMQIMLFDDLDNPTNPTSMLNVWPSYYRYTFNASGMAIDSTLVNPDSTLRLVRRPYFRKFEVVNRYEIGRYITPYGNGLNLNDGFVWTFDVSDYRTLLADTVRLLSINSQELVDIEFEMIKGTPPRDPIAIENLWVGNPSYGTSNPIENFLTPKTVQIPANAANVRLKMRPTGHGFGGNENCAEFCPKEHTILVNGTERFNRVVWKDDCGLNPVYPQGGTWVYNRANWCPGDLVPTYDLELTPHVTPGQQVTLDYNVEPYTWNGQGSTPYYAIETQLVSYSAPNFTLDASLEAIKSPSTTDIYKRMNPICGNPIVTIKNTGTTPLTSLKITYGVVGAAQSTHTWTGNLGFLESADVELGGFSWSGTEKTFRATVSEPNGGSDEYANNNSQTSTYTAPPVFPSGIIIDLKTNNFGEETSYELRSSDGTLIHSRSDLDGDQTYRDTLTLPDGCYEFRLLDTGGDGLDWWANRQFAGTGSVRIRRASSGSSLRQFNADFGAEVYQQFTVGYDLSSVDESPAPAPEEKVSIYPNPTPGEFSIDLQFATPQDVFISVRDLLGNTIHERSLKNLLADNYRVDLSGNPAGVYIVTIRTDYGATSQKVVVK